MTEHVTRRSASVDDPVLLFNRQVVLDHDVAVQFADHGVGALDAGVDDSNLDPGPRCVVQGPFARDRRRKIEPWDAFERSGVELLGPRRPRSLLIDDRPAP